MDYDKHRLYAIITYSTAIEGSTITCTENTVMFDDGFPPSGKPVVEQLMNLDLKRAYEVAMELAQVRTKLTLSLLKALSSLVMQTRVRSIELQTVSTTRLGATCACKT